MKKWNDNELYCRAKKMLVRDLRLKISLEEIKNDTLLFSEGLGLDSIDALELVIAIEKEFGVRIPDAALGSKVLVSVETMVNFIKENQHNENNKL